MTIRALLVDDHAMLREGLRAVLEREPEVEVVGESTDGLEAIATALRLRPDVVVMDIGMRNMNGIEATRELVERLPECRVLALSVHSDRRYVDRMLQAGASGYVLKESASSELVRAIRTVHGGERYLSPRLGDRIPGPLPSLGEEIDPDLLNGKLAPREREVLKLLAEGRTSKRIAELLAISPRTVETHRRNIMRKLRLHSVAELTKFAIREGLTTVEP